MALSDKEIREFWDKRGADSSVKPLNQKELKQLGPPFRALAGFYTSLNELSERVRSRKPNADGDKSGDDKFTLIKHAQACIEEIIIAGETKSTGNSKGLSVSQFLALEDFKNFCVLYWGQEWGELIPRILAYRLEGIYQISVGRRSYRSSKNAALYSAIIQEYLTSFNYVRFYQLGPDELLTLWMDKPDLFFNYVGFSPDFLSQFIALELDNGNTRLTGFVHTAVYDNSGLLSHHIIKALCASHQENSWRMLADLLKAARLQEGLRQAITESCDEGYLPAFRYLFKSIYDNNLLSFTSVKRAFDTWTGMGLESIRDRAFKKNVDIAYQYLDDHQKARAALDGDNPMEAFLGLWAIGCTEVEDARTLVLQRCFDPSVPMAMKVAFLLFCNISNRPFTWEESISLLELYVDQNILRACVLDNTPLRTTIYGNHYVYEKERKAIGNVDNYRKLFERYMAIIPTLPEKEVKITHPIFSWIALSLSTQRVWEILIMIAHNSMDQGLIDRVVSSAQKMPIDARGTLVKFILEYLSKKPCHERHGSIRWYHSPRDKDTDKRIRDAWPVSAIQRSVLFTMLQDKSPLIRGDTLSIISGMDLTVDELIQIENLFSLKTASIRKSALQIIQASGKVKESAKRLRDSGNAAKILAANELDPPEREATAGVLQDKEHGFGLYDPNVFWEPVLPLVDRQWHPAVLLKKHIDRINESFSELDKLIAKYKDTEFTRIYVDKRSVATIDSAYGTLDTCYPITYCPSADGSGDTVEVLPEVWNEFCEKQKFTVQELLTMIAVTHLCHFSVLPKAIALFYQTHEIATPFMTLHYGPLITRIMQSQLYQRKEEIEEGLGNIIKAIAVFTPPEVLACKGSMQLRGLASYVDPEKFDDDKIYTIFTTRSIRCWFSAAERIPRTRELFACRYHAMKSAGDSLHKDVVISIDDFVDAYQRGQIGEQEIFRCALDVAKGYWGHPIFKAKPLLPPIKKVLETALELELKRGDMPTDLSRSLYELSRIEGTQWFIRFLHGLGKYKLVRGGTWYDSEKASLFSTLIQHSVPGDDENVETLKTWLKLYPVDEQRLIEAAMYAPAWLDIVGEYLKVKDLAMAGWYFQAHVNESLDDKKCGVIARWSPVSPQEFKDGAFDPLWFKQAYKAVGKTMFDRLYDAAKYVSAGANHRRSQIFADAALKRLKARDIEKQITEKRNKDYVMALGILPGKDKDFLHRYEVIQQFRKESSQFGAQRQASERRAADIALGNLARTVGCDDVNRFVWKMESAQFAKLKHLLEPKTLGDVTVQLTVSEEGNPEITTQKNGKQLKSIPAVIKKDKYVLELVESQKKLREQRSRAFKTLETAMIRQDVFSRSELESLNENPILAPMINNLLWKHGKTIDFWESLPSGELTIAHPVDLLASRKWSSWQKTFIERQLVQPFKQVFRELYTLNEDEKLLGNHSDRYAGHQVLPRKGIALLKSRGWIADYDSGLGKVDYRQNIIIQLTATADWFSPSDIEPPTLESIYFRERGSNTNMKLENVPPILFSEIMRDLDLMVSVAHAGGVDPEASHSTVEMRAALVTTLVPYLKLKNVEIKKSHALIKGHFGDYSVHLGSGICHLSGKGMLHILPVHSQSRGRVFLPFADDDPKTAEVITKILVLAEDVQIKDPTLLNQLRS